MVPSGPIKLPELRHNRCEARMPTGFLASSFVTLVLVVDPRARASRRRAARRVYCGHHPRRQRADRRLAVAHAGHLPSGLSHRRGPAAVFDRLGNGVRPAHRTAVAPGRGSARGARAQHCRLPACHPADGWPRRDHGDGLARGPRQRCARQDCNPSAVIAIVLVLCFVVFALAARIAGFIGATGNVVLSRLLGVILAALAVQYIVDGVRAAISG